MASLQAQAANSAAIEYCVYVYLDSRQAKSKSPWEMKGVTNNMDKAMADAENYHNSRQYKKVEVKKKYFDEKNARTIDMTLKTFEGNYKKEVGAVTLLGVGVGFSAIAFLGAYFLTLG